MGVGVEMERTPSRSGQWSVEEFGSMNQAGVDLLGYIRGPINSLGAAL